MSAAHHCVWLLAGLSKFLMKLAAGQRVGAAVALRRLLLQQGISTHGKTAGSPVYVLQWLDATVDGSVDVAMSDVLAGINAPTGNFNSRPILPALGALLKPRVFEPQSWIRVTWIHGRGTGAKVAAVTRVPGLRGQRPRLRRRVRLLSLPLTGCFEVGHLSKSGSDPDWTRIGPSFDGG
jgi:hypothetical protein